MTRPISARTRADAIAICEQRHDESNDRYTVSDLAEHVDAVEASAWSRCSAYLLAFAAWNQLREDPSVAILDSWLEASGILRDGWCPSGWDVVAKAVTP